MINLSQSESEKNIIIIICLFFQPGKGLKLNTDANNLPASVSTETLSSESTGELFSTDSSLTGISFSSSSEALGICDELDRDTNASTDMKDSVTGMPANSSPACLSPSLEDDLECAASSVPNVSGCSESASPSSHDLVSGANAKASNSNDLVRIESIELLLEDSQEKVTNDTLVTSVEATSKQFLISSKASEETSSRSTPTTNCSDVTEKPIENINQNSDSETVVNSNRNLIEQLQEALQKKTESEVLLKQKLESLGIELNSAENNSDYWFNQCVKKREKIELLLSSARDMNSSNFELRQEINNKSRTINEKDQEIQTLKQSKTETEMLLQEVKEKLAKANEETELLKVLIRKYDEGKLRSVQADQMLEVKTSRPITLCKKSLESQNYKGNDKSSFYTTHKGMESNTIPSRDGKALLDEVKNSGFHFGRITSLSVDTMPPNTGNVKEESTVSGTNVKSKSPTRDEIGRKDVFGSTLSDESSSLRDSPFTRCSVSKDPEKTKKAIREWLGEIIRQAKTKLSREQKFFGYNEGTNTDGRLKHAPSEKEDTRYSLREVVSSFKEKISKDVSRLPQQRKKNVSSYSRVTKKSKQDRQETPKPSETAVNGSHFWNRNERESDAKDASLDKIAAGVSTDTFDSIEPFADVFLTNFESIEASLAKGIDSVEPFGDVFIPWQESEDAEIKQTTEAYKKSKECPDKNVYPEEKKPAVQPGTIREMSEISLSINMCVFAVCFNPLAQFRHRASAVSNLIGLTVVQRGVQHKLNSDSDVVPESYQIQDLLKSHINESAMIKKIVKDGVVTTPVKIHLYNLWILFGTAETRRLNRCQARVVMHGRACRT